MFKMLSKFCDDLTDAVDATTWTLNRILTVNHIIVEFIGNYGRKSVDILTHCALQMYTGLCYCFVDLGSFLVDVFSILSFVVVTLGQGVSHIFTAVNFTWTLIINCMAGVLALISGSFYGIGVLLDLLIHTIVATGTLLWKTLTLIGNTIIFTLCTIPEGLNASVVLSINGLNVSIQTIWSAIVTVFVTSWQTFIAVGRWAALTVVAIPVNAYYGLALYCLIQYLVYYLCKSQRFRQSVTRFGGSVEQFVHEMIQLICKLRRFRFGGRGPGTPRIARIEADRVNRLMRRPTLRQSSASPAHRPSPTTDIMNEVRQLKRQLSLEKDTRMCIVCQDREKCVLILPCRHLCLCQECSDEIQDTCPVCREVIFDQLQVFL